MPDITLKPLGAHELRRVYEIDVTESGTIVYRQAGTRVEATDEEWTRHPRSEASWDRHIAGWMPMLENGGVAVGAFDGEVLAGVAVFRPHLSERMAQLAALFVSKDYRRTGVASLLTAEVERLARESGASELYVSAIPSESAFGFYSSRGFRATERVNEELFALEPDDIHMIKAL